MTAAQTRRSLTGHLLAWALAALVLVWTSFVGFAYLTGEHEADELTDGHLASVSTLLLPLVPRGLAVVQPGVLRDAPAGAASSLRAHDYQQSMSVQVWDAQGRLAVRTGDAPLARFDSPEGFATIRLGQPPQDWRAYTRWDEARQHKMMVLLSLRERDDLASDIAEQVMEPGLWLLPVVALVLGLAVHRGLRPLRALAEQVHALDIRRADGLAEDPPFEELQAATQAINRLVGRYHAALDRERGLANEFAHELRTPLAALALQARHARDLPAGPGLQAALAGLQEEALRAGDVLNHLLALARASRAEMDEAAQPVDVVALARQVVASNAPRADASGRELGLEGEGTFLLPGHGVLLELALRNLVDNALAHTPPGTHVTVRADATDRVLAVEDDGPARASSTAGGDQPADHLGLGLGHKVVAKVAALHGAVFESEADALRRVFRLRFASEKPAGDQA